MALLKAREWRTLIDTQGIKQADIARAEGISRARVTQVMKLLSLPADVQESLVAGRPGVPSWSIKKAIREAELR